MTFEKLSADEIAAYGSEYVAFLKTLKPGEGARASVGKEGVTKITLKKRLRKAADIAGVSVKFIRSPKDAVVLQVMEGRPRQRKARTAK
jgi:hypothetical protein